MSEKRRAAGGQNGETPPDLHGQKVGLAMNIRGSLRPNCPLSRVVTTISWKPSAFQTIQNMKSRWIGWAANLIPTPFP